MKKRMNLLLFISWVVVSFATGQYLHDLYYSRMRDYTVSYVAKTRAGVVAGYINVSWTRKAGRDDIIGYIKKSLAEEQEAKGEPEIVGDVVILNVFDKPWN